MIEWYDFYIFGSLAVTISPLFYPEGNDTLALIAYLSTFAVGFVVRPFGALFFGRIGDLVGRKYAFLVTLLVMSVRLLSMQNQMRRLRRQPLRGARDARGHVAAVARLRASRRSRDTLSENAACRGNGRDRRSRQRCDFIR